MAEAEKISLEIPAGPRRGAVMVPRSKSHEHRLLIANFLAGESAAVLPRKEDNADILATKRCLVALAADTAEPILDCGESGSTLRFLAPVAAALGKRPRFIRRGRLAERPFREYSSLAPGVHELAGDVSSQFVTGLLFALPLLAGDSEIRFTSPLESRGYVEMTLQVLRGAGIVVAETPSGFRVAGGQRYHAQSAAVEGDWSGAAFWYGMNALGSAIAIRGLDANSAQPDRVIAGLSADLPTQIDVAQCPDIFPVLAVIAAGMPRTTTFTGVARLRLKECDRLAAMREMLARLGIATELIAPDSADASAAVERFLVHGTAEKFRGATVRTFSDHRIAMAAAVAAVRAAAPITIDDAGCCAKSYPGFFEILAANPLIFAPNQAAFT